MQKNNVMKISAAFAMLTLSLPLIATVEAAAFKEISALRLLFYYLFSSLPILSGYILYKLRLSCKKPIKIFIVNLLMFITSVIISVLSVILINIYSETNDIKINLFLIVTEMLPSSFLWFYLGIKLNKKSFSDVFTFIWLGVYLVETFLCYITASIENANTPAFSISKKIMVYQLIIIAMITVLLINQTNIQTQINQRRNTNLVVPTGLKRYNAKLISVVGIVILAALMLKDLISGFINWIFTMTLKLIDAIIMNIKLQQQTSAVDPDTSLPNNIGELISENEKTDLSIYIIILLSLILLIVFRKKIVLIVKKAGAKIFKKYSKNPVKQEEYDYIDYYQPITTIEKTVDKPSEKECIKAYKKETDPIKKYRIGYKLVLMWMDKRSNKLNKSCTVDNHKRLMNEIYHGDIETDKVYNLYSSIRYNDISPNEKQIDNMTGLLSELYK